jgi:hypothetical protein
MAEGDDWRQREKAIVGFVSYHDHTTSTYEYQILLILNASYLLNLNSLITQKNTLKSFIFWDTMLCGPLKVNRRFGGTCLFHLQGRRISCVGNQRESRWQAELVSYFALCSTLKMEATYPSETLVDIQQNTRRYIPEDQILCTWNDLNFYPVSRRIEE